MNVDEAYGLKIYECMWSCELCMNSLIVHLEEMKNDRILFGQMNNFFEH